MQAGAMADDDDFSLSDSDPRDVALVVSSGLSALGSSFVIFSYWRYRSLRRHPSQLILSRSFLDLVFCVCTS